MLDTHRVFASGARVGIERASAAAPAWPGQSSQVTHDRFNSECISPSVSWSLISELKLYHPTMIGSIETMAQICVAAASASFPHGMDTFTVHVKQSEEIDEDPKNRDPVSSGGPRKFQSQGEEACSLRGDAASGQHCLGASTTANGQAGLLMAERKSPLRRRSEPQSGTGVLNPLQTRSLCHNYLLSDPE